VPSSKWTTVVLACASFILASCSNGSSGSTGSIGASSPTLQSITVSPGTASVAAGLTQQFAASGAFSDGSSKAISTAVWSVSDPSFAKVDSTGLVTTLKQGSVGITATSGTISNTASLTIAPPLPTTFNIVPGNVHMLIGSGTSTKLSAMMTYTDGSTSDVSAVTAWGITNSFVASIDSVGNVTPSRTGYAAISATSGAFSANTGFTVIAAPRYLYFASEAGHLVSKAIIDPHSGLPRMAGYIPSGLDQPNSTSIRSIFPCPTTDPLSQFLYVESATIDSSGNIVGGELLTYSIAPASGTLTPIVGSPFSAAPAGCVDFEPTGKYGYASFDVNNATLFVTFSRDVNTGILTLANTMNLGAVPTRAAIDPLGQYLYVGASSDLFRTTTGFGFQIDPATGTLTPLQGSPFKLSNLGGTFTFHPSGNFVFMANTNGQSIDTYSVARATGVLTLTSTIATCINPTAVRFSPDGAFAYTTCAMNTAHQVIPSIESFAVGSNGALSHLASTPSSYLASDITVDPSGSFLYLSSITPYILASTLGPDGVAGPVRSIGTQQNPSLSNVVVGGPLPVNFTPATAYLTSAGDNTLTAYRVNADGTLTAQIPSASIPASPFSLSLWPWGSDLVLAAGGTTPDISFFSLSSAAGLLTSKGSLANAATVGGTAIDPSGQFAFQTDSTNGVVYTYQKLSGGGWALDTYQGTPPVTSFTAGAGAGPIVVDPAGLLVFIANQNANSISMYQYFGIAPELLPPSSPVTTLPAEPLFMAIDPNESFLYVLCSDQMIRVFSVSYFAGGLLTQVASASVAGQPSGLTVEPGGHFVYTADSTGVSGFAVNAQTGALTALSLNPAIALSNTTGVYAEPGGSYLYVTTGSQTVPGAVLGYSIQTDGTLTAISATPLATPKLPTSMAFTDNIQ
jgi:6-phosphogluconolactonase (cycloisomerase 2 family)